MNQEITKMLIAKLSNLTLSTNKGKFLADKSYGFDTMFFASRFIQRFRFGNIYKKLELRDKSNAYIADLFCLRPAAQIGNYFTEAIALLEFCGVLQKTGRRGVYEIIDDELLDFISSSFENAYIFQYMLCYCVFKHDGIWNKYRSFCNAPSLVQKQDLYLQIRAEIIAKDSRVLDQNRSWADFVPKYPMVVLNYANHQNMISRTTTVQNREVTIKDIALNTEGTRANTELPKKNAYLQDFSNSYVIEVLRPYLVTPAPEFDAITYSDSFSIDVADTKLDMLDDEGRTSDMKERIQKGKYRISTRGVQTRTVQGEFRSALFVTTPHKCPVCGFDFKNLLIASHIKPYAKCDDTYDAMNPNNGLLMCPICDKLFEQANYITIDYKTGHVIYDTNIEDEKSLQYLHDCTVPYDYIDCERRHYLKWHNDAFYEKHSYMIIDNE